MVVAGVVAAVVARLLAAALAVQAAKVLAPAAMVAAAAAGTKPPGVAAVALMPVAVPAAQAAAAGCAGPGHWLAVMQASLADLLVRPAAAAWTHRHAVAAAVVLATCPACPAAPAGCRHLTQVHPARPKLIWQLLRSAHCIQASKRCIVCRAIMY